MRVVVLIPRRADNGRRDLIWSWVRDRWAAEFPDWDLYEGHHDKGPFNRSAAINAAAADAGDWDVAVIADSDSFVGSDQLEQAVATAARTGQITFAHDQFCYLNELTSDQIMGGYRGDWWPGVEWTLDATLSSMVVVTRGLWEEVGGFDTGFRGWGMEDVGFYLACVALGGGEQRIPGHVWHLHHQTAANTQTGHKANVARMKRYEACDGNPDRMRELLADLTGRSVRTSVAPQIPRRLIRTVPEHTTAEVERFWSDAVALHPDWDHLTLRDPIDRSLFPLTSPYWDRCESGAQLAGLVRLEALWNWGGIYLDSDIEPYRSMGDLLTAQVFACWEDPNVIPDAVLGAPAGHPVIRECLDLAVERLLHGDGDWATGRGAWSTGPGVTTTVLTKHPEVLLLPTPAFYPAHYSEKANVDWEQVRMDNPDSYGAHRWHASWLP